MLMFSQSNWIEIPALDQRKLGYLISGIFILVLAGYYLFTYTTTSTSQSTFNLQPNLPYSLQVTLNPSDSISGSFQENSHNPVSFYVQSSAEYAAFQNDPSSFAYVYRLENAPSGNIEYTVQTQDTYHLLFRHGLGLINNTETVFFQRSFQTHNSNRLFLGVLSAIFGAVELVYAFRLKPKVASLPPVVTAPPTPQLVGGPTPSSFLKTCPKCGAENPLASETCRVCSTRI